MSDSKNTGLPEGIQQSLGFYPPMSVRGENLWEADCANREPFSEMFVKIIDGLGTRTSKVFLLDGEWGSGKTFFLRSFQQHLKNEGYNAIYFDAFSEDFSADPLLAICGQLWKEFNIDDIDKEASMVQKAKQKINEEWRDIFKDIINITILKNARDNIKSFDLDLLAQYADSRRELTSLRQKLSKAVTRDNKPLVFIIDELDRCRPTFALELLERVKHLFQAPGIIFVFGANKKSLMNSVQFEYGLQKDEYLQKFFDFELNLPKVKPSVLVKWHVERYHYRFLDEEHWGEEYTSEHFFHYFYCPLMDLMGLTLRQAEHSMSQIFLFLSVLLGKGKIGFIEAGAGAILIALRLRNFEDGLYQSIAHGGGGCNVIMSKFLPQIRNPENNFSADRDVIKKFEDHFGICLFVMAEGGEKEEIEKCQSFLGRSGPESFFPYELTGDQIHWVKQYFVDRSQMVAMVEKLGFRS